MEMRRLGKNGPEISAVGLGCMGMSGLYGPADDAESIATIHAALDSGINYLDTGDFYGMGHNESLLAKALTGRPRDKFMIGVKFGAMRDPRGAFIGFDARPVAVRNSLAYTLRRLGTDYIDLYQPARVDASVPIEDTIGAIADMVKAGYVRCIGVSEASATTIRRAIAVHPIVALQIEYSIVSRSVESDILPALRELGIGMTAYGIFSRGLLTEDFSSQASAPGDIRGHFPRFQGENLERNQKLVRAFRDLAASKQMTPAQLALAWVLAKGTEIIPLIGTKRCDRLFEALKILRRPLSPAEIREIEAAVPADAIAGERYNAEGMHSLDSERERLGAKFA